VVRVTLLAVPLGAALGLGLWTLVSLVPRFGAPRLARRVAPYVLDVSPRAREVVVARAPEPGSVLAGLAAPALARLARGIAVVLGGDEAIARRLRQAGDPARVERFRSRQLLVAVGAAAAAVVLVALWARVAPLAPVAQVVLVALAAAGGLLLPERLLARRAAARLARIGEELPTVLDLLALALTAGEGVHDALRRVSRIGGGELARELARVVAEANAGAALPDALARCSAQLAQPALSRAIDQLLAGLERGAPLAQVLRAQAADVREDAKRRLLESAGAAEIKMLFPLVLLILPVTVLFALWPASLVLQIAG